MSKTCTDNVSNSVTEILKFIDSHRLTINTDNECVHISYRRYNYTSARFEYISIANLNGTKLAQAMSVGYFSRGECPSAYDFINYGSQPDKKSTTSVINFNLAADCEYIDLLIFGESIHNQRFRDVKLSLKPVE